MRTALAVVLGIVVGGAAMLVVVDGWRPWSSASPLDASGSSSGKTTVEPTSSGVVGLARSGTADPSPVVDPARPITPAYGRLPEEPRAIYRCRSDGRTTYSNTPCNNGTVVDDSSAVKGFDSRPSAGMERLVAEGRGRPTVEATAPRVTAQNVPLDPAVASSCESMRRQIIDIDNLTRFPNSQRTLDYWRDVRRDIRTTMAREHC